MIEGMYEFTQQVAFPKDCSKIELEQVMDVCCSFSHLLFLCSSRLYADHPLKQVESNITLFFSISMHQLAKTRQVQAGTQNGAASSECIWMMGIECV
jgi:hypothetical protein